MFASQPGRLHASSPSSTVRDQSPLTAFFDELSDVLDQLVTFAYPVFLVGDVNIRLERTTDPVKSHFIELLATYGPVCRATGATPDLGGTLDIIAMRGDLPQSIVDILDVGLSDHRLLRWSTSLARPCSAYTTATS